MLRNAALLLLAGATIVLAVAEIPAVADALSPYPWLDRTELQAAQVVRDLEHNPALVVQCVGIPDSAHSYADPTGGLYTMVAGGYQYEVAARARFICRWKLPSDASADATGPPSNGAGPSKAATEGQVGADDQVPVTQDGAAGIAFAYMQSHFECSSTAALVMQTPPWTDDGVPQWYSFDYANQAGNGFTGPANCSVMVDWATGEVVGWIDADYALTIDTSPAITADQAIAAAAQDINYVSDGTAPSVADQRVGAPDSLGAEELVYDLTLPGYSNGDFDDHDTWYVSVDANTGAVLSISPSTALAVRSADRADHARGIARVAQIPVPKLPGRAMRMTIHGERTQLSLPVLTIEGQPYIPETYALAASGEKAAALADGTVSTRAAAGTLEFRPGCAQYTINGQTHLLRHVPIRAAGIDFVPLELASVIAPGRFVYNSKAGILDCRPAAP